MNKAELLKEILGKEYIDALVDEPTLMERKPDGSKLYCVNVRETSGKCATYRNIYFYVIDEGTKTERAFYKDSEIASSLRVAVLSSDSSPSS